MGNMFLTPSRPFYQSVSMMHLESIPLEEYIRFASMHFKRAGKEMERKVLLPQFINSLKESHGIYKSIEYTL